MYISILQSYHIGFTVLIFIAHGKENYSRVFSTRKCTTLYYYRSVRDLQRASPTETTEDYDVTIRVGLDIILLGISLAVKSARCVYWGQFVSLETLIVPGSAPGDFPLCARRSEAPSLVWKFKLHTYSGNECSWTKKKERREERKREFCFFLLINQSSATRLRRVDYNLYNKDTYLKRMNSSNMY